MQLWRPLSESPFNSTNQAPMRVYFLLVIGLGFIAPFQAIADDRQIGIMPGSAAPRSWRTNAPKGFIKNDFCFEGVCRYDRIVSTKGDIVITDRVTERGEPIYEYFEVKKTQRLWNCKDGTMGWRNYKRLKSDQGNWMPWHWGAYRYYTGEPWLDDPHLKRICQAAGITR